MYVGCVIASDAADMMLLCRGTRFTRQLKILKQEMRVVLLTRQRPVYSLKESVRLVYSFVRVCELRTHVKNLDTEVSIR